MNTKTNEPGALLNTKQTNITGGEGGGGGIFLFNLYNLSYIILKFEMARKPPKHIKHNFMPLSYLLYLCLFQGPFSLRNGHVKSFLFDKNI